MNKGRMIRRDNRPEVAWKNGGGMTRQIACYPPDAGLDDFRWRLSMARVDISGVFSHFADVDRVMAILDGRLELDVEGAGAVQLSSTSAPYSFAGDVATYGCVRHGAVTDLNLMVRRGAGRGEMCRIEAGKLLLPIGTVILFALYDSLLCIGTSRFSMQAQDSYIFGDADRGPVFIDRPALLIRISS